MDVTKKKTENVPMGILMILTACLMSTSLGTFVKLSNPEIPTIEKVFFRNIPVLISSLVVFIKGKARIVIEKKNILPLIIRCICANISILASYYSVSHMNMADSTAISKLNPIFLAILSAVILKEYIPKFNAFCYGIVFLGGLLVIKPSANNVNIVPAMMALLCAVALSINLVMLRILGTQGFNNSLNVLFLAVSTLVITTPFTIANFVTPSVLDLVYLICGAGISASIYQFALAKAYTYAPAGKIAIFAYTQIIFTSISGFIVFSEIPDLLSIIGYVIIISVSVIIFIKGNPTVMEHFHHDPIHIGDRHNEAR